MSIDIVVTILTQGPKIHTISKGKSAFDIIPDTSFCGVSVCFGTGLKQDVVFSDDITSIGNAAKVTGDDVPELTGWTGLSSKFATYRLSFQRGF